FGICGCLAQKEKSFIKEKIPAIDLIFGPSQVASIDVLLKKYLDSKKTIIHCNNKKIFKINNTPIKHKSDLVAYIQIMKGCNNFCSYCIVPYTRGAEESRPVEEILAEIKNLSQENYKEILLLGQNVNSYGNDGNSNNNFLSLLTKINNTGLIKRIRFTTSHPKDFNLDLIKVIKNGENICEHIHLPLQSGSDRMLYRMNRKYTMSQYYQIINHIKSNIPEASITTDAMVGFPGETEEDFTNTIEAFKKIRFDSAYTFIYSNRDYTLSSLFENQIPLNIKKERLWKLMEIQKAISLQKNQEMINNNYEILVENKSKKGLKNQYWGRTRTNKTAVFYHRDEKNNNLIGKFVIIKIINTDSYTLYGELIDVKQ
ncbi:MAG: tRNA (N6-isopentenyl adenosine(37)-C2)-methylthiotransferase MiaB, partial [Atribacterota bacterium]|nr:tRNA (N6-isopentenyl adenosine(37)-C2)-methylthiotransferase MiaB [Atribacterota bacterium]